MFLSCTCESRLPVLMLAVFGVFGKGHYRGRRRTGTGGSVAGEGVGFVLVLVCRLRVVTGF